MTGRLLKLGGQGSSGGSGSGDNLSESDLYALIEDVVDNTGDGEYAFGFPGVEGGDWSEKDFEQVADIIATKDKNGNLTGGIDYLIQSGQIKVDKKAGINTMDQAVKRYLNELMEDGGITIAQYQALKLWYGIE